MGQQKKICEFLEKNFTANVCLTGPIKNASHEVALKTFLSNAVDSFFIIILSLLSRELRKPPWLCVGRG